VASNSFSVAIERVLSHEGGYTNYPSDPGGETNWGITSRTAARWGYKGDMRFLPREKAVEIYENEYWLGTKCDLLPFPLSFQLFDAAVNSGPTQAIKWLQRSLGVDDDGVIGPVTLSAMKGVSGPLTSGLNFLLARGRFYTSLPTWTHFGKGWTNRLLTNLEYLVKDAT
jgi:lysozyme family protein